MEDLGPQIAYMALERGTPVYDSNGAHVGDVEEVLGDERADIFDSLRISAGAMHGRHLIVTADHVEEIHERGVRLSVPRDSLLEG